jgi:exopolysaccharide biosynthesis polyprenyl glycosylphosphotransferase
MQERAKLRFLIFVLDGIGLELAFFAMFLLRFRVGLFVNPVRFYASELILPSIVLWAYWIFIGAFFGLYRFDPLQGRTEIAGHAFKTTAVGVLLLFVMTFEYSDPLPRTRVILLSYWGLTYLALAGDRVFLLTCVKSLRRHGIGLSPTLIVGTGERAKELLDRVRRFPELGFRLIGVASERENSFVTWESLPVLGSAADLTQLHAHHPFHTALLALDPSHERMLPDLIRPLSSQYSSAYIPADQYPILLGSVRPRWVFGHPLVAIQSEILPVGERALKRLTDIVISIIFLICSLPIWLALCIVIPLDSPGPIFYVQKRVGRRRKSFSLIKFRSMREDAEAHSGPVMAKVKDPRITRIGRFTRASRLDELPQLLNVIMGHMSLVGPRPERREFVERFSREIPLYERRLNVKPGITGWSQVHLRYSTSTEDIALKLRYDLYYIENLSLALDFRILLMTLLVVLRGEGRR